VGATREPKAVGAWRLVGLAFERAVEVRDRLEPARERHLAHPSLRGRQQLLGRLHSHSCEVVRERHPHRASEDTTEVVGTEPDAARDLGNVNRIAKVGADVFVGTDDTGRSVVAGDGKPARRQLREIVGKQTE